MPVCRVIELSDRTLTISREKDCGHVVTETLHEHSPERAKAWREKNASKAAEHGNAYVLTELVDSTLWACRQCEWTGSFEREETPVHVCGRQQVEKLGDKLERLLTSYGVSKEWWVAFKAEHGLPSGCKCAARQAWFNKLGEKLPPCFRWCVVKLLEALTRTTPDAVK